MRFYGDSFYEIEEYPKHGVKSTIVITYKQDYDKEVFKKIYNLLKNDKNVKIELFGIEE